MGKNGIIGNLNFYLKEPRSKEKTQILLHYHFNGQKLKYFTGLKTTPQRWNKDSQRIKKSEGSSDANDYLDKIKNNLETIHLKTLSGNKEVTPDYLKEELKKSLLINPQTPKGFFDYLNEYYLIKQGKLSPNYLKKVNTLKNHLKEFEKVKKYKLTFNKIDLTFYDLFSSYLLTDKKQLNNTIGSNISILKTFLVWATSRGYNTNYKFKEREFKSISQDSQIIYLTESELMNLFELDLSNNPRLNNVRETFCFSCFTGLRFSDVSKVKKDNIQNDELKVIATKTKKPLSIPMNDFALEILKRNNYKLPVISNQKTNDYLKELAELAGINEPQTIVKFRGVERIEFNEPKHNLISSHTGRRTFVTLSLEKGMRIETVMEITGHSDYKMIKKYISLTSQIKKMEMKKVWTREPLLKVVS